MDIEKRFLAEKNVFNDKQSKQEHVTTKRLKDKINY